MSQKIKIKKGDLVKVISGADKNKEGRVLDIIAKKNAAIVENCRIAKKHTKPTSAHPQGGIVDKAMPINVSNLMLIDSKGNATKVGRKVDEKTGKLVRYSKKTGEVLK